jgi:hypothetical protein
MEYREAERLTQSLIDAGYEIKFDGLEILRTCIVERLYTGERRSHKDSGSDGDADRPWFVPCPVQE